MLTELTVELGGKRIDAYLAETTEYSRSRIQNLLKNGCITVNGKVPKSNYVLRAGETVLIEPPEPEPLDVVAQEIPLDIVYEDADLCVINKPQGMVVHPAPGHADGTLVNALLYHLGDLSSIGGVQRPGIVHRIDKLTSGLLVVAKNDLVHQSLSEQFRDHSAGREYLTIACGNFREDTGTIDAPIGRHPTERKRMAIVSNGREAITHWKVVERFGTYTLLKITLETGRTHQIRVHLASEHHPVAGDTVYGSKKPQLGLIGQALHGFRLHFFHPTRKEPMTFTVPLPDYFVSALHKLGWTGSSDDILSSD